MGNNCSISSKYSDKNQIVYFLRLFIPANARQRTPTAKKTMKYLKLNSHEKLIKKDNTIIATPIANATA